MCVEWLIISVRGFPERFMQLKVNFGWDYKKSVTYADMTDNKKLSTRKCLKAEEKFTLY